jgi:hypothetical protein
LAALSLYRHGRSSQPGNAPQDRGEQRPDVLTIRRLAEPVPTALRERARRKSKGLPRLSRAAGK